MLFVLILIVGLLASNVGAALDIRSPEQVLHLSSSNFTEAIEANQLVLVIFYAPWCGYCKTLMTELTKVAADLPNMNIDGKVAIVDATVGGNDVLGEQQGMNGFPSMILYRFGKRHSDYHGPRGRSDILQYLKKRMGPPAIHIDTLKELEEFADALKANADIDMQTILLKNQKQNEPQPGGPPLPQGFGISDASPDGSFSTSAHGQFNLVDSHAAVVLALFVPGTSRIDPETGDGEGINSKVCKLYLSLASVYDQARFLYSDNPDLLSYFNVKQDHMLIFTDRSHAGIDALIPSWELVLDASSTEADVMTAIAAGSLPLLVPYSVQSQPFIHTIPVKKHALVFVSESDASVDLLRTVENVASDHRGKIVFVTIPSTEHQLLQYFALDNNNLPELVIADMTDEADLRRFNYKDFVQLNSIPVEQRFGEAYVRQFISEFQADTLLRSRFSELSEEADKANKLSSGKSGSEPVVKTIVGSQFVDLVMDNNNKQADTTDVLLYIHAPWCAHCKSFEPVLTDVAQLYLHMQGVRALTVLKVDGSRNEIDHEKVRVRGYPTIYLFKAGDRANPVEYDGERTVEYMARFIDWQRALATAPAMGDEL